MGNYNLKQIAEAIPTAYDEVRKIGEKPKQDRYKDNEGKTDYLDRTMETMTPEQFRGAMMWTIGKYIDRLGQKDDILKEVYKIADYANRWHQFEVASAKRAEEMGR